MRKEEERKVFNNMISLLILKRQDYHVNKFMLFNHCITGINICLIFHLRARRHHTVLLQPTEGLRADYPLSVLDCWGVGYVAHPSKST